MNKFYSFILAIPLSLNFCQASSMEKEVDLNEKEEEISTDSDSSQGDEKNVSSGKNFLKTIEKGINADILHCFVFNIGQGNFVVLKFNSNIMVIDGGFLNASKNEWNAFYGKNENVFNRNPRVEPVVLRSPMATLQLHTELI